MLRSKSCREIKKAADFIELEVVGMGMPSPQEVCKYWTSQINVFFPTTRPLAGNLKDVFEDIRIRERIWSKQPFFFFNFGCGVRENC